MGRLLFAWFMVRRARKYGSILVRGNIGFERDLLLCALATVGGFDVVDQWLTSFMTYSVLRCEVVLTFRPLHIPLAVVRWRDGSNDWGHCLLCL